MMNLSAPLLAFGFMMIAVGAVILFMSFRPRKRAEETAHRSIGIVFIGPIPIVFGGVRRLGAIGIIIAALVILLISIALVNPHLVGW